MRLTGPAARHRLVTTPADPSGRRVRGTFNNCGNGYTPWGTYLTCEENFNGYFHFPEGSTASDEQLAINERYGLGDSWYQWWTTDSRFLATGDNVQEPNRHGWIVEIDPMNPRSRPLKRTALGRIKHEGAAFAESARGHAVVYMGDDQRFDYVYKYVSRRRWRRAVEQGRSPLNRGTLYVARFDDDGTGVWLPLVQGQGPLTAANGFADQGDVLVKTRLAADLLGATPMDRPEWIAVNPLTNDVFCNMTNNSRREEPNAANPRSPNLFGHNIKISEAGGDAGATTFEWEIAFQAGAGAGFGDGSDIPAAAAFGSPDGLGFDPDGRLWIQTDGGQPIESNDQMVAYDPATGDFKRFLTGPKGCEVTGITWSGDRRTMFINIQHPGDDGEADNPTAQSTWPDGDPDGRPRAATVAITKDDGGIIGT